MALFSSTKYRLLPRGSSSTLQDDIPMSQFGTTQSKNRARGGGGKQGMHNWRWYFICYFLHAFLVILHIVLLGTAASHHAEHQITVPDTGTSTFTTWLSGGLQAFYSIYAAILVFVTQKLTLSTIFSRPKKLTQIHDICGAWGGLGAALNVLWQQTKVTSSILSIILVTVYFVCIAILHVTSSTLMQFQQFYANTTSIGTVTVPWPNASVDLASMDWTTVATVIPFLQILYENATLGLVNNTLYDTPLQSFVTATVNATTLNAHCGLLTNLSADALDNNTWTVSASMSNLNPVNIMLSYPPLLNEIWFSPSIQCSQPICSTFILYLVSAELDTDDSVGGADHIDFNGTYYPPGAAAEDISSSVYFVACSLNTTDNMAVFGNGIQLNSSQQQTNRTWSTFSPGGDLNLTSAISLAIASANSLSMSPYCQPVMSYPQLWENVTMFNVYMRSVLGMGESSNCSAASLTQYTGTPLPLTRDQVESAVSQIAAEFIWLAGVGGGGVFDPQVGEGELTDYISKWWLNINILPVIFALCASVVLFVLAVCLLWGHQLEAVSGAGVLEVMWFGSRSRVLRGHLGNVKTPSLDSLRASSMVETIFWTRSEHVHEESSSLYTVVPFSDDAGDARSSGPSRSELENIYSSDLLQRKPSQALKMTRTRRLCYALHIVLVAVHVTFLAFLIHHPEQSVIISSDSEAATIGLSAALQATYTLYSAALVLLTQRLALFKAVGERRKLTAVHDISSAWNGLGAAILILWQQHKVSSSAWETVSVVIYLAMMLMLHITSSSIMQWEFYDDMLPIGVMPTYLPMPNNSVNISQLGWTEIFPATLYDVRQDLNAPYITGAFNETTLIAQCGLVPNLTLTPQNAQGEYQISFQNGTNYGSFLEPPIWKDVVHAIAPSAECVDCPQTLFYMITTSINVNESLPNTAIELDWFYTPPEENTVMSTTLTYVAACSLSSHTVVTTELDANPDYATPPTVTSWPVWTPGNVTNLSVGMATALWGDITSSFPAFVQGNSSANFTDMDSFIMSLLGLDLSAANTTSATQSSADPSTTLSPWQLESVIAQTATKFLWVAGVLGEDAGGFQRATGESPAFNETQRARLLLNTTPVVLASAASFVALILATIIISKGRWREYSMLVAGTSVLECLWIEAHSDSLHTRLLAIEDPQLDRLRREGMFDVCLGEAGETRPRG